jgi:hypothetical protein
VGVVGVVALDRRGDRVGQIPAAGEDAADQRVVDAELAALVVQALLGRARGPVDLPRIAGVGVHEHELADVVQEGGDEQPIAVRVAGGRGEAVGGALDGHGVQAEALGRGVPGLAALEELERLGVGREALDGLGREHLDRVDDRLDLAAARRVEAVGEAHDGDHQRDVGLDGAHHVARRGAVLGDQGEQPVPRLGQRRKDLQRFKSGRQALAVPLVAGPADDGVRRVAAGAGPDSGRCGGGAHERVIGRRHGIWSMAGSHGHVTLTMYRQLSTDD